MSEPASPSCTDPLAPAATACGARAGVRVVDRSRVVGGPDCAPLRGDPGSDRGAGPLL